MTPAKLGSAVLVALVTTALAWVVLDTWIRRGGDPLPLPWTAVAGTAVLVVAVLVLGWPVRRWVQGRRDRALDPLRAARAAVLAKAAVYGGALLTGWYLAQALVTIPAGPGPRRSRLIMAGLAALAALALVVSGFVVQRWCRVPPGDDQEGPDDLDQD